jgi:hypothetical protein
LVLLVLLVLTGCQTTPDSTSWNYSDLRVLDARPAPSPSTDILAVYVHNAGTDLEIRIDFLDLPVVPDSDLSLHFMTTRGDFTVFVPADGTPTVSPAVSGVIPRVARDPSLDTVTLRFNSQGIPQPFSLQVLSFLSGQKTPADETTVFRSDALPPLGRAALVIAFWDTFPAATPAEALRDWDGAHSGPDGGRHGLHLVLNYAEQYQVPLVLLDLKTSPSLAALNFMQALPLVRQMNDQGLLLLPDVALGEPAQVSLSSSRQAASTFYLTASQFVYAADGSLQHGYQAQFLLLADPSHLSTSGGTRLVPLPSAEAVEATDDGPSLAVRQALFQAALSGDASRLVVLGGDLPNSTWGNQDAALATFAWIAAHPWIRPLTGDDLLAFPVGPAQVLAQPVPAGSSPLLADLRSAPRNVITQIAWQDYLMLTTQNGGPALEALRSNYLGQVSELLAAAHWAQSPYREDDCDHDLNGDGRPECILASQNMLAILDPDGARLTNLFYLDTDGPHQLVAPYSQYTVGLSDPSVWQPNLGEAADPGLVPGAFFDNNTWTRSRYLVEAPDGLIFQSPDGRVTKEFRLSQDGLQVTYQADGSSIQTEIPLLIDPQSFFNGDGMYQANATAKSWTWGLAGGLSVTISTDARLSADAYISSAPLVLQPEDPNFDYPPGHYMPFPFSLVTISAQGSFTVSISVK